MRCKFALIGRVAALAAKSPYVGAAFGFYGPGRAGYSRFIAHGKDVDFPQNTRIEVVLSPERVNLKPVHWAECLAWGCACKTV